MEERQRYGPEGWLDLATAGIRFKPDRAAVRAELKAHLEDKCADLRRLYPDIDDWDIKKRATAQMGDPEEVGRALAKLHRPWLGYLWRASQVAVALAVALTLCLGGPELVEQIQLRGEIQEREPTLSDYYLWGEDVFSPGGPFAPEPEEGRPEITRTPLLTVCPEETVELEDFRLRVTQDSLWSFRWEDGREEWWLFWELEAAEVPWLPLAPEVAQRVRGEDSRGNTYASTLEGHGEGVPYILTNGNGGGLLSQRFRMSVSGMEPGAEWFRLEYDRDGVEWSLTIPLTERGEGT